MKHLLILLALLVATPALAIDEWVNFPGTTAGVFQCGFPNDKTCWWDVTQGGVVVTTVLDVQICENITVQWDSNLATVTHLNTATVFSSMNGHTISATDLTAEPIAAALTGVQPLFAHYGFDADFIYVRFVMNDAGATGRISVHCFPRID